MLTSFYYVCDREIALNRVTEELKQEMDATKSFCVKKAFDAIDDW